MRHTLLAFALLATPALAQAPDDKAPPYTPPVPRPDGGNQPVPVNTVSEERIAQIVDGAVNRALARMQQQQAASLPTPSSQSAPATGSPQAYYQPQPVQYVQQPVTTVQFAQQQPTTTVQQQVQVLVPAGPCHRAMARLGEHLAAKGQPHVRTLALAPATTTTVAVPTTTTTLATVPVSVPTPPAAYTPPLPATSNPPLPSKSAPAKGSPQR